MRDDEAKAIVKEIGNLFPELKTEQIRLLVETILPYDRVSVITAMKNHRLNHTFFDFPGFVEGVRAEHRHSQNRLTDARELTTAAWLARLPEYRSATDATSRIMLHFGKSWEMVNQRASSEYGKQQVRRLIRAHAHNAAVEIGLSREEAAEIAADCIGLSAGESVPVVPKPSGGNIF